MSEQKIKLAKRATCGCRDREDIPHAMNCPHRPATDVSPGSAWQLEAEEAGRKLASWHSQPATDEEIAALFEVQWCETCDRLRARIDTDREKMAALENTMFDAGIAYAEREHRDGENIAALEAEAIKSAERIEEYRSELRERDDRLSGLGVETAALRADKNRLLVSNDRLTEKNDKLEALNAEMLEALYAVVGERDPKMLAIMLGVVEAAREEGADVAIRTLLAIIAKAQKGTNAS